MRIIQLVDHWSGGGVPNIIELIYDVLVEQGHEVRIISYRDSDFTPGIKYRFQCLHARFPGDPNAIIRLRKQLNRFQPDIIHDHYGGLWALSYLVNSKWRDRSIFHVHNEFDVVDESPDQDRTIRTQLFLKMVMPLYNHLITVSQAVKDTLKQNNTIIDTKATVVHNSINCNELRKQHELLESEYGHWCDPYDIVLGSVGRLVYEKGIDTMIEVLASLRKKGVNAGLIIVGDGDTEYVNELKQLIGDLNIGSHCYFAGRQSDVYNWMKIMDLFLFGSRQEPFGLTLLESMCAGTPVIALPSDRKAGPSEFLEHKVNALLTDSRDPDKIATQIVNWRKEDNLFDTIISGGIKTLTDYNPEAYAKRLMPVYQQVIHSDT